MNELMWNESQQAFIYETNKFMVKVPNQLKWDNNILFQDKTHQIMMVPKLDKRRKIKAEKINETILFKNIFRLHDLQYQLTKNGLKERIVINQKDKCYCFTFCLKLTNLIFKDHQYELLFLDPITYEIIFRIPEFFMEDCNQNVSTDIDVIFSDPANDVIEITIRPNKNWLDSQERVFPVILDPSIHTK